MNSFVGYISNVVIKIWIYNYSRMRMYYRTYCGTNSWVISCIYKDQWIISLLILYVFFFFSECKRIHDYYCSWCLQFYWYWTSKLSYDFDQDGHIKPWQNIIYVINIKFPFITCWSMKSESITTKVVSSYPENGLSVTCSRSIVFTGYSGFLHQ